MHFKLITPPGMLFTTALLVIYATCAFMIGSVEKSWLLQAGGIVAVVATYGVAMVRPWSRWIVYLLAAGFFAKLGSSIYTGVASGFFEFQFGSPGAVARSHVRWHRACCWRFYRAYAAFWFTASSTAGTRTLNRPAIRRVDKGIPGSTATTDWPSLLRDPGRSAS